MNFFKSLCFHCFSVHPPSQLCTWKPPPPCTLLSQVSLFTISAMEYLQLGGTPTVKGTMRGPCKPVWPATADPQSGAKNQCKKQGEITPLMGLSPRLPIYKAFLGAITPLITSSCPSCRDGQAVVGIWAGEKINSQKFPNNSSMQQ